MKVFISHTFSNEDKELASILFDCLKGKKIEGYLAEEKKDYDLLIRDKIRLEIESSDYVVGIVTNQAKESASVNQELGYALGKNIPILIMIEKNASSGVLTFGIEPEEFERINFKIHCENIRKFILDKGIIKKPSISLADSLSIEQIKKLARQTHLSYSERLDSINMLGKLGKDGLDLLLEIATDTNKRSYSERIRARDYIKEILSLK